MISICHLNLILRSFNLARSNEFMGASERYMPLTAYQPMKWAIKSFWSTLWSFSCCHENPVRLADFSLRWAGQNKNANRTVSQLDRQSISIGRQCLPFGLFFFPSQQWRVLHAVATRDYFLPRYTFNAVCHQLPINETWNRNRLLFLDFNYASWTNCRSQAQKGGGV